VGTLSQPLYDANVNKPVGYWLIKVLEREPDSAKAHVNAILIGSLEEANEVKARLEKGEDFATVAREVSQLKGVAENGGDLGLVGPEEITPTFDTFAFDTNIPLNTLSAPIRDEEASTPVVYWLVKAESKADSAKISDADRDQLKSKELEKWVAGLFLDPETRVDDSNLTKEKKKLATLEVIKRMRAAAPSK
jgi:parvulin-like peptidyl-prolyl isomerase